ncbi:extracellular solute-binding protein [Salinibacterium sp.]|nr:extracellular solute-binding protein [Salinibacterium sp.]
MRFSLAITAGAVALALALTGCSTSQSTPADDAAGAAQGDGTLTLYVGRDEALIAPLIEKFTEATGIDVTARYASSSELNALLLEEGDNTPAEAFLSQDAGALGSLSNAGLLSKLPADLTTVIPAGFTSANGMWLGVTGRARVIAYDSETVDAADVPNAIATFTDPNYAGEVAFAPGNASMQSFVTAMRVLDGEDAAEAWVKGMSENSPVLTEKNGETLDLVNSGEVSFGLINHYYWFEDAAELGADAMRAQLAFLAGDAGGMVNVTGAGILKGSKGDPDALAFLEYLISEEGQRYFVEQTYEYPLLPGVAAPDGVPALNTLINPKLDLSDLESLSQTQELLAKYGLL